VTDAAHRIDELLAHASWLEALARRLVGDTGADDLVQEVWLQAARRPPRDLRSPRGWLASALRSAHRRRLERAAARRQRERESARDEALPSADELVGRAEAQRVLVELVLALPASERDAVLLHHFDGLSAAEIARRSGEPDSTVRNRLARAVERLRERLDARSGGRERWLPGVALLASPRAVDAATSTLAPVAAGSSGAPTTAVPVTFAASVVMAKSLLVVVCIAALAWFGSVLLSDGDPPPRAEIETAADHDDPELARAPVSSSDATRREMDMLNAIVYLGEDGEVEVAPPAGAADDAIDARGAVVLGRVVDPDGAPVAGARVFEGSLQEIALAARDDERDDRPSVTTDEAGAFEFAFEEGTGAADGASAVPERGVVLVARAEGFAPSAEFELVLEGDARVEVEPLVLRVGARVDGIVHGLDDLPVAGRSVQITSPDLGEFHELFSDADGRFAMDGLTPGPWRAATFPSDAELERVGEPTGHANAFAHLHQVEFRLDDGGVEELVLGLPAPDSPRVTGTVTLDGVPQPGFMQWYPVANPSSKQMVRVGDDGAFEIDLPEPGLWVAHANAFGRAARGLLTTIDLGPGEVRELDLVLSGARVTGRVVDALGAPVDDLLVELVTVSGAPQRPMPTMGGGVQRTDEDGAFAFDLLPAGSYAVAVLGSEPDDARAFAATAGAPFEVDGEGETVAPDTVVAAGRDLELIALDTAGRPVSGASVWLHAANGLPLSPGCVVRTDEDGRATTHALDAGAAFVTVTAGAGASATVLARTVAEGGDALELVLQPTPWLAIGVEDGVVDPTRDALSIVGPNGCEWAGLYDVRRLFEARPERERSDEPLFAPLPAGRYTVTVVTQDGERLEGEVDVAATGERLVRVLVAKGGETDR